MSGIAPGVRVADRYVVLEELGRGGMGVVYLARDEREERDVAIKVLREAPQGEAARRLQREARAMSVLDPKGVAQVYEVGETPARELYLVMEYVRGRTLRAVMRKGRVERAQALGILRAVATTLGQAHRAGLVHRDVKPDNVMVGDDGRVVLLDFGIVKRLAGGEETAHLSTQLTGEGSVIGTPAYLSPEQALGRKVGPETDQFALAVMAYEVLSGTLPWTATEVTTILAQVLAETPMPASSLEPKLNAGFDAVLSRALAKTPSHRFGTVDELADALDAAERGAYVPFEVSETIAAPAAALTGGAEAARASRRKNRLWRQALAAVGLGAVIAAFVVLGRIRQPKVSRDSAALAVAALSGPEARLGCPILEVRGVTEVSVRLGAAAATLVCARAAWNLGGRNDRVLAPAALLDIPREPVPNLPDPYVGQEQREHTIALARGRADAYVDGIVTREAESWHVELVVRAPDAREIARAEGRDARYAPALTQAMDGLWRAPSPLVRRGIDAEIARWTGFPDADTGLAFADLSLMASPRGCPAIRARSAALANAFFFPEALCRGLTGTNGPDAGLPTLDESSPALLAASVVALKVWGVPIAPAEEQRLLAELDDLRAREASTIGRAALGNAAGFLSASRDPERTQRAFLQVVREDPLDVEGWKQLVSTTTISTAASTAVAAAWFPSESMFLQKAGSYRGDEIAERLVQARLAYALDPALDTAMHFGRALAEAGREEEARAIIATRLKTPEESKSLEAYLLAFLDLHGAKLERGTTRLEAAGNIGMNELVVTSGVTGRRKQVSTRWAERFLSLPDEQVSLTARGYVAPMALCMSAESQLAKRCLDRISTLGHADENWWGDAGDAFLKGAQRYVLGDTRGAVGAWRSLVASPEPQVIGILPTEAFELAGQPDLAARLDARKLPYTFIAGVSEAAPREAKRALAAGDKARAKALAEKVVQAWEVADIEVPAVAEMKALLKTLRD